LRQIGSAWGSGVSADLFAPSVANDESFRRSWARFERFAVSPAGIQTLIRMLYEIDVREVLPIVRVPTLVVHREGDRAMRADGARYLADRIMGAKYVELTGADHFPFVGDVDAIVDGVQEFLGGARTLEEPDRVLATILFMQVVEPAHGAGEDSRHELHGYYEAILRRELARLRGRQVKTAGEGSCAVFDGPARAIRCACAVRDAVRKLGAALKAGLHAGECELLPDGVGGPAVDLGAAVMAVAAPGEVLVTGTVKDLVAGPSARFEDRGTHHLQDAPEGWRLFAADVPDVQ
jgi:class 3 adenylate cyclase